MIYFKRFILSLILFFCFSTVRVFALEVSVDFKDTKINKIFGALNEIYGIQINSEYTPLNEPIDINYNGELSGLLKTLSTMTGLSIVEDGKNVIVRDRKIKENITNNSAIHITAYQQPLSIVLPVLFAGSGFTYSFHKDVSDKTLVSVSSNLPIRETLSNLLNSIGYTYTEYEGQILQINKVQPTKKSKKNK